MTTLSYTVTMPAGAASGTWELKPEIPYSVAGSVGVVAPFRGDINSSGVLTAKGGGAAQVVVPASGGYDAGMGVLTTNFNIGPAVLPGRPIRVRLVETTTGDMNISTLLNSQRGQILTPQQAVDVAALIATAAATDAALRAIAGSLPFASLALFPSAGAFSGQAAVALDTGAVYRSDGTTWGLPIGYVVPRSTVDSLATRMAAVEAGQSSSVLGYVTLAALNADLAHPAGSLARVTNDSTAANNADFIKLGASGTGSWQVASTSRIGALESRLTGANFSTSTRYINGQAVAGALADSAENAYLYVDTTGRVYLPQLGQLGPFTFSDNTSLTDAVEGLQDLQGRLIRWTDSTGATNIGGDLRVYGELLNPTLRNPVLYDATGARLLTAESDGEYRFGSVRLVSKLDLNFYGDSITAGVGSSSITLTSFPARTAVLLGRSWVRIAYGGTDSTSIAQTSGAIRTTVAVTGGSIPASGAVDVAVTPAHLLVNSGSNLSINATIAGIPGVLLRDTTNSKWTFTRTAPGNATAVAAGTPIFFTDGLAAREHTTVIMSGTNDSKAGGQAGIDTAVANVRAIVAALTPASKRYVVLSILPGTGEPYGSSGRVFLDGLNLALQNAFPANYCDVVAPLIAGTADGVPPASLRIDAIHLNDAGYEIVAQTLSAWLRWKGY